MKDLKRVEIKNGKFTLEGKVVEATPLKISVISDNLGFYESLSTDALVANISFGNVVEKAERMKKSEMMSIKRELKNRPKKADAYVKGKPLIATCGDNGDAYYPILYLKIKGEK